MTMREERGTLLKLQATASKLISVCTAAYNGNEELVYDIPNILAHLNDLYGKGFGANVYVTTSEKEDSHPMNEPIPEPTAAVPEENDGQSVMRKTLTVRDEYINSGAAGPTSYSFVADNKVSPMDEDGIPAKDTKPLSLSRLAHATDQKKEPTKKVSQRPNKPRRLKSGVKVALSSLFLIALLGTSRFAGATMNVTAASPESASFITETTPEPIKSPLETAAREPAPTETPVTSAEPEETAEPDPSEALEANEEGDVETVIRKEPLGTAGRLYFDNGWSVALNYADSYDTDNAQTLADAWDSACYMKDSGKIMIADHATQGFNIILDCTEGTRATLVDADGNETRIICKSLYKDAYWEDGFTHLPDGRGIWGAADGSIGMQTSTNSDGTEVFISYWDPVEE